MTDPDPATDIVVAMRTLAAQKRGLQFALVMEDASDPRKHAILKANCDDAAMTHMLALALARLTAAPSTQEKP